MPEPNANDIEHVGATSLGQRSLSEAIAPRRIAATESLSG